MGGKALRGQAGFVEFVLDLGFPVPLCLEIGGDEKLVVALKALHTEEWVILGLIDSEERFAGLEVQLHALALQQLHQLGKLIRLKDRFQPYLKVAKVLVQLDLLAEQPNNVLEHLCGDDWLFSLPSSPSLLNAVICSLFQSSLFCRLLSLVDILLLIIVCIFIDPDSLDLNLLYLQLKISILHAFRPHIFIDTGVLVDFFREDVLALVEVAVLLLVIGGTVHVGLELDIIGGRTLLDNVLNGFAGLFDLFDAWTNRLRWPVAV